MTNPPAHLNLEPRARAARGRFPDDVSSVLTLRELAHVTGASYLFLRRVVERRIDPYRPIASRNADDDRAIVSPEPVLMDVQRWILRNCLASIPRHQASYAYHQGISILDCAKRHSDAKWLFKFDLRDFFHSILETRAYQVFRSQGYAPLVSLELARLTTHDPDPVHGHGVAVSRYRSIPTYATRNKGHLPQGAPTSGALANAVVRSLDQRLDQIARRHSLVYTRYSDDITLSSFDRDFARAKIGVLRREVLHAVRREGFQLHHGKTKVAGPGSRLIVLGLLVGDGRVRLMPELKRRIEVHVRGVEGNGLIAHCNHRQWRSTLSFISHIDGLLAHAHHIDETFAADLRTRWNAALSRSGYPT